VLMRFGSCMKASISSQTQMDHRSTIFMLMASGYLEAVDVLDLCDAGTVANQLAQWIRLISRGRRHSGRR
jgi:hypothetical protein